MISNEGNPLAEVALALSMAFFSLMVLMLFSITQEQKNGETNAKVDFQNSENNNDASRPDEILIIFSEGKFYDKNFNILNVEENSNEKILLAVDPKSPMSDIMEATQLFQNRDLQLTTFSGDWQQRFKNEE